MSVGTMLAGAVSVLVLIYLVYTLLRPEKL